MEWPDEVKEISNQEAAAIDSKKKEDEIKKAKEGASLRGKARVQFEKLAAKPRGARERPVSSRTTANTMTDRHDTNHVLDDNYCQHDDVETWQIEADLCYFKEKYRHLLAKRGKESDLLDRQCIKCKGQMPEGTGILLLEEGVV